MESGFKEIIEVGEKKKRKVTDNGTERKEGLQESIYTSPISYQNQWDKRKMVFCH
jgi:hypothetical protein